ncbi:hypothetical protein R6Q57_008282 [Mikania cordata]
MKDLGGRSRRSGTVIKKKSSSGCLIIKKITDSVAGDSGFSDSSSRNLFKYPKGKKRSHVVQSDSESSDSACETIRHHNGSVPYKGVSRGLDVFEFDEYDRFDDNRIRKDSNDGRYRWNTYRQSGDRMESGNGGCRPASGITNRFEIKDDECDLPLSVLRKKHRLSSGKSIRLQGRNGVLKVMVNENKQMGISHSSYDDRVVVDNLKERKKLLHRDARDRQTSVYEDANKKKTETKSLFHSDSVHMRKPIVYKSKKKSHSQGELVKNGGTDKKVSGIKGKECKIKHGTGTEKQILREKIKKILIEGGWTIDYRPRRNRDYLDAVYINPSGTGYWSIIKAYDAFQKEEEGNSKDDDLRDEILGKLTRQTQKKKEMELKNKREIEDDEEEKFNSYGRKSRKIDRCSLLVRGYDKAENNDGFVPYLGRRTLFSWLIDSGVVQLREHVEYMNPRKTQILQKGWITKDGIHCSCCSEIVTVSKFEAHAGSKFEHPFPNIFLESGKSLMQCQIDAWNKLGELERTGFYTVDADGDDPNDDTCGLCGDGGDLICCDGCPSTFHQTCLDLPMLPQGDWFCPNCSCKYCEITCTNSTQASLTCYLCQKKYHETCRLEIEVKRIESDYPNLSFCGHECHELHSQLQKLVGVKHKLDSEFSWSFIHRSELLDDLSSVELSQRVTCNSMLAVAMPVMDECFLPFTDRRSGINLIRNVVFNCGSNLSRLNYSGFFTAILEKGDEVACAASIRIHGTRLAEMPFIATRHMYRRQGMCRRLLSAIEMALSSLQVEKLMIPAIPEHMDTWTDVFGFYPLEESDKQELKCMNMVVFPRTDMLQKLLNAHDSGSPSGSVDAPLDLEPNAQNGICFHQPQPQPQLPGMEYVSINQHSNANLDEIVVQDANLEETVVQNGICFHQPQPQLLGMESVSVNQHSNANLDEIVVQDANLEETVVQNGICFHQPQPQLPGMEFVSIDAHCEPPSSDVGIATTLKE